MLLARFRVKARLGIFGFLAAVLGIIFGLGAYTFVYARGFSYFSDDPQACLNCHVMRDPFDGLQHSSHRSVAVCNDCHTPHTFPEKWLIKGLNGWNHSVAFTTGNFPDPIRIKELNARVAQQNCVECHQTLVSQIHRPEPGQELFCVSCHGNVGHGR